MVRSCKLTFQLQLIIFRRKYTYHNLVIESKTQNRVIGYN